MSRPTVSSFAWVSVFAISCFVSGCGSLLKQIDAGEDAIESALHMDDDEKSGSLHLPRESQAKKDIEYGMVVEEAVDSAVAVTGEVLADANKQTHVTTPVTGLVTCVEARVGDKVTAGTLLLNIKSTDIQQTETDLLTNVNQVHADLKQALLQIDCDLATARAQQRLSESMYNRIAGLADDKIASRADYDSAKTQLEKDRIAVESLVHKRETTQELSKQRLCLVTEPTKTKLRILGVSDKQIDEVLSTHTVNPFVNVVAPSAGEVSERLVNIGEQVYPTKPLFTISNYQKVWLKADVFEKDESRIHVGQLVEVVCDSLPHQKFSGRLDYIAPEINPDTRTLLVRAEVPNPGLKLKPKMFARTKILVGAHKVLTVPLSAIQAHGSQQVVYVQSANGSFEERKIVTGGEYGERVEIIGDVHGGEKVVTKGSFALRSLAGRRATTP
jgi:membrane fusion protein, heavy metal efflux system